MEKQQVYSSGNDKIFRELDKKIYKADKTIIVGISAYSFSIGIIYLYDDQLYIVTNVPTLVYSQIISMSVSSSAIQPQVQSFSDPFP